MITIFRDRHVYPETYILSNQYENMTRQIEFDLAELPTGHKYLILNKEGYSEPFIINNNIVDVTSQMTWEGGSFSANIVVCKTPINGALNREDTIFISDTFYLIIKENNINIDSINNYPIHPSLNLTYQKMLDLIQTVETKLANGEFKGDKGDPYTSSAEFQQLSQQVRNDANASSAAAKEASQAVTTVENKVLNAFPVGTVISSTNPANPSTYIGGTWEAYAQGRTLVGAGTGNDGSTSMSFAPNSQGGEYNHTLTTPELPTHTHRIPDRKDPNATLIPPEWGDFYSLATNRADRLEKYWWGITDYVGENSPHNNIQPYAAVYYWKRIS